jgi:hypothetical protein
MQVSLMYVRLPSFLCNLKDWCCDDGFRKGFTDRDSREECPICGEIGKPDILVLTMNAEISFSMHPITNVVNMFRHVIEYRDDMLLYFLGKSISGCLLECPKLVTTQYAPLQSAS